MAKSTTSKADSNLHGALAYLLGPLTGVIFLLLDKEDKFVKYHSMQSIIFFVGMYVLYFIAGILSIIGIGLLLLPLLGLVTFLVWLFSMYKAYNGEMHELPVVGKFAKTL